MTINTEVQGKPSRPKSQKWEAELVEIIDETPDIKTFRFHKPENWNFIPGQYVMVYFPEVFGKKNRAYSIASSPTDTDYIDLSIKLYGVFTHHIWNLREGSGWLLKGPYGRFHIDNESDDPILLLGAGVGITPLMSMIRWATLTKSDRKILLLFSNKRPKDILYKNDLIMLERMNPNLRVIYTLTRLGDKLKHTWPGLTGRIDADMIRNEVLRWQKENSLENATPISYGCGPIPMLETMEKVLLGLGWPKEQIHYEKFW